MRKNNTLKWITVVILVIATISLVFGSFIMLFGNDSQQNANSVTGQTIEENQ